jgi:hypothetical protein
VWGTQGPAYAAMTVQGFLLVLPMLNAAQWVWRSMKAWKSYQKETAKVKPRLLKLAIMRRRMIASSVVLVSAHLLVSQRVCARFAVHIRVRTSSHKCLFKFHFWDFWLFRLLHL